LGVGIHFSIDFFEEPSAGWAEERDIVAQQTGGLHSTPLLSPPTWRTSGGALPGLMRGATGDGESFNKLNWQSHQTVFIACWWRVNRRLSRLDLTHHW